MDLLIGGPGTGKTTALVNKIKAMKPEKFSLLSFTRQAANEAKDRLAKLYQPRDLDWVRTIHSLAFRLLKLSRGSMFTDNHLKDFGHECGFEFPEYIKYDDDDSFDQYTQDEMTYRQMIILDTLGDEANRGDFLQRPDIDFDSIAFMYSRYTAYKKQKNLLDFNDILKICMTRTIPRFDLLCIDECQDLSPLQFALANRLALNSTHTIFAGDDDQMIYEWAGVKRSLFMELPLKCNLEILVMNHRLSPSIIERSQKIVDRCKDRIPKPSNLSTKPENFSKIKRLYDFFGISRFDSSKSYLILVRNSLFLRDVKDMLDNMGVKWTYLKHREGKSANVKLSTIHGSKGAEADVVILFTDVTNATYQHITSDSEHRVWYVAMTRTKDELYIVDSQGKFNYEIT